MDILLKIILIIGLQAFAYFAYLRGRITGWGASKAERDMPLVGDERAPGISATRAITIDAPIADVWRWIVQLGADRGGFFSYELLEKLLGYEMTEASQAQIPSEMAVGRVIPASMDDSKSLIKFNFPVLSVDPGKSFVLGGWGAFVLQEISPERTRLIVRTHAQQTHTLLSKIDDFTGVPMHYIMERRMLLGLKTIIETGRRMSSTADNLWILGMVLSGLGIAILVIFSSGYLSNLLSAISGILWLWALLAFEPRPVYSAGLFLAIAAAILLL